VFRCSIFPDRDGGRVYSASDVVRRKLLEINEATGHLRSWTPITIERLETDQQLRCTVERGLQVATEALFDAGPTSLPPNSRRPWTNTGTYRSASWPEACCRQRPLHA
jgi:hypothetical protein